MLLYQILTIKWKSIKKVIQNNKFKVSAATWNEEFEYSNGSYFVSNFQEYFEYMLRKHGKKTRKRLEKRSINLK